MYDKFLGFELKEGYCAVEEKNDEGDNVYSIKAGKTVNDEGEVTYEHSIIVHKMEYADSPFAPDWDGTGFSVEGQLDTFITVNVTEQNILFFTINVYVISIWIKKDTNVYRLIEPRAIGADDDEKMGRWVDFLNDVMDSVVLDGTKGEFEKLTVEKITSGRTDIDKNINSDFPIANPLEGQHTHLDFLNGTKSLFGGLFSINQNGTEYAFKALGEMWHSDDDSDISSVYEAIDELDTEDFDLVGTAYVMSELFRVDEDVFDMSHDREQEILEGLICKAEIYDTFRSFAWILQAYCEKEGCQPVELDFDTIQELVDFIEHRDGLNYVAGSYSPAICSGDDIHNYFIPDSVSDELKQQLINVDNMNNDDESEKVSDIRSLNALRKELDYMYPAIKVIYDELESTRDTSEVLEDGVADILYAWCSITYAARRPIFTEDGPVNCCFISPTSYSFRVWKKSTQETKKYQIKEVGRVNVNKSEATQHLVPNDASDDTSNDTSDNTLDDIKIKVQRGQRDKLEKYVDLADEIEVVIKVLGPLKYKFCCLALNENGRLISDDYMICSSQPESCNDEIIYECCGDSSKNEAKFMLQFKSVSDEIKKMAFAVYVDGNGNFGSMKELVLEIRQNNRAVLELSLDEKLFQEETSVVAMEIYEYNGNEWRFAMHGSGFAFDNPKEGLLYHYGR